MDILVVVVKDVPIRRMVMDVNSGVYVNQIFEIILNDVNYKVYTFLKSFKDTLNVSAIY